MTPAEIIRAHMAALGRKGGKRRMETMTPEQRQKIARKGGKASGRARKPSPAVDPSGTQSPGNLRRRKAKL